MKKISVLLLAFLSVFCFCLSGCENEPDLLNSVTEARTDIFYGKSNGLELSCAYGFTGKEKKVYTLTFKLYVDPSTEISYAVSVDFDKTYSEPFTLNPVTHTLTAIIEAESSDVKNFVAKITYSSKETDITLTSTVPENTLSVRNALSGLKKSQPSLIESYLNDYGEFDASIAIRLIVKDDKPYYYVAFTRPSGDVKALLLDGFTAEVLAIREIF